jgi:hypothetical protein
MKVHLAWPNMRCRDRPSEIANGKLGMKPISRRRAITLASSYLATGPLLVSAVRAQPAPATGLAVFEMTSSLGPGVDADAAFAKALAAISKLAGEAARAGGPVHIVFNLGKNATYRITRPLAFKALHGFELNGNGAQLINTTRGSTLTISGSSHVTVRDLTIDYDPLPFTQGTIAAFDKAALQITVKVDVGYPDDPAFLATITDGFFKVMDRRTKALKAGARDFLTPAKVERISPGLSRFICAGVRTIASQASCRLRSAIPSRSPTATPMRSS